MVLIIVLVILALLVVFVISAYNKLVRSKNKVKTNWSQIDVVLKRRADLIPNLVETVKGYAAHEKDTLEATIAARNKYLSAGNQSEQMEASGELSSALNRIMMLGEAYPQLKADTSFNNLQKNLEETENKIQFARQFYNDSVYSYMNLKETFPSSIIAGMFNFQSFELFTVAEGDREVPKVDFNK
ncbi:LemA protein [Aequitasia blattaphilus]|uniref:LemA family protein n=1 Tax=Aequitasia blattaphilus TaxID=2949332 RepID=A0ABT1ECB8_9FIRM|nr:LemA family protein [Aequitasia blattaphilus]MCP1103443.1 LemA family protein [Aequitasia blattaphilus]MCR8616083.1 LemA family protein [Aequitasia blattaphilus]